MWRADPERRPASHTRCRMADAGCTAAKALARARSRGLERMRRANTRHGGYSEDTRRLMQYIRALAAEARRTAEET
jgi:hypothetical protein